MARYKLEQARQRINSGKLLTDEDIMTSLGVSIRPYNYWNFIADSVITTGRIEYTGRTPAGIIYNTLYFFTKQGDLVVDPMAGSGTVGDCCL